MLSKVGVTILFDEEGKGNISKGECRMSQDLVDILYLNSGFD